MCVNPPTFAAPASRPNPPADHWKQLIAEFVPGFTVDELRQPSTTFNDASLDRLSRTKIVRSAALSVFEWVGEQESWPELLRAVIRLRANGPTPVVVCNEVLEHVGRPLARCLGNGGMPAARKVVADYPVDREIECFSWRRITSDLMPSGLILDDPTPTSPNRRTDTCHAPSWRSG
jgi:hypothetical protein